jgi:hypothetical protein
MTRLVCEAMSRQHGFDFKIRPHPTGWSWATYDQASGEKLVEGAAATRAQAAACVIRCIATRAGTGEEARGPARTPRRGARRPVGRKPDVAPS